MTAHPEQEKSYDTPEPGLLRRHWQIVAILAASAILRALLVIEVANGPCWRQYEWEDSDMNFFHRGASRIASGDLLLDAPFHPSHNWHAMFGTRQQWQNWYGGKRYYQEPGYYYIAAAFYAVFSDGPSAVKVFQLIAGLGTILLCYVVSLRWLGKPAAIVTAVILALCGPLYFYDILLLRASLLTFTTALFLFAATEAFRRDNWKWWLGTGLILGFAFLLKSTFLLLLPAVFLIILWTGRRDLRKSAATAGLMTGTFLILLLPLFVRNALVGAPILSFSSVGSATFVLGNGPESSGDGLVIPDEMGRIMEKTGGAFWPVVRETYASHDSFAHVVTLWFAKTFYFFRNFETPNNASFYAFRQCSVVLGITFIGFWLLTPLMTIGVCATLRKDRGTRPLLLLATILILLAPTVFFFFVSRYRAPAAVPFAIFGGCGAVFFLEKLRARKYAAIAIIAAIAVGAGFFFNAWTPRFPGIRSSDYGARAVFHMNRRSYDAAAAELQRGVSDFPADPALNRMLGESLIRAKRFKEAHSAMKAAIEHRPDDPQLHRYLALSQMALGLDKEAIEELGFVLRANPQDGEARLARANLLSDSRRYDEAAGDLEVLVKQQENPRLMAKLIECRVRSGALAPARDLLRKHPEARPLLPPDIFEQLNWLEPFFEPHHATVLHLVAVRRT